MLKAQVRSDLADGRGMGAAQRIQHHDERIEAFRFAILLLVAALGVVVSFSGCRKNVSVIADDDQVPMILFADGEDEHSLVENVDFFRPTFDLFVSVERFIFLASLVLFAGFTLQSGVEMTRVNVYHFFMLLAEILVEPRQVKVDDVVVEVFVFGQSLVVVLSDGLLMKRDQLFGAVNASIAITVASIMRFVFDVILVFIIQNDDVFFGGVLVGDDFDFSHV